MYQDRSDLCLVHSMPLTKICVHYMCNYFHPLCDQCLFNHDQLHDQQKNVNFQIISCLINYNQKLDFKNTKKELEKDLQDAKTRLEQMIESMNEALKIKTDSQLEHLFRQIDEIKTQVNYIFTEFKDEIAKRHRIQVSRLDNEIIRMYEDLRASHETCQNFLSNPISQKQMKKLKGIDLNYQIKYKEVKTGMLQKEKQKLKFEAEMIGEYKMKLFSSIRQNLKNMLNYDDIHPSQSGDYHDSKAFFAPNTDNIIQIKNERINMNNPSTTKNWLFYFKAKTKTFLYSDVSVKANNLYFDKITLNMQENINIGNCSVLGEDSQIYLLGGVNSKINMYSENYYKNIYQLDFNSRQLIEIGQMINCRSYFSVASIGKYLYVVGGINYLEGTLMKCERFDLENKLSEPINYLNSPSSHHNICTFQDKYIYKFGGLKMDNNQIRLLCDYTFERYSIEKDIWQNIVLKDINAYDLLPKISFHGGIFNINESQLLIVGGQLVQNEIINQCFLFNVQDINNDNNQQNLYIKDMNTKLLPWSLTFKEQSNIIYRKQLYVIGTGNHDEEKKICIFDGKNWKKNKA